MPFQRPAHYRARQRQTTHVGASDQAARLTSPTLVRHLRNHLAVLGARWRPIRFQPTTDPDLAPFGESFDVMGDGSMIVVPTPGHLPGSVSMLVRRPQAAPVLMVGDLTYSEQMLLRDQVPATGDPKLLRSSFAKVRALRERLPDLVILPAHDPDAAMKLQSSSPQFAEH